VSGLVFLSVPLAACSGHCEPQHAKVYNRVMIFPSALSHTWHVCSIAEAVSSAVKCFCVHSPRTERTGIFGRLLSGPRPRENHESDWRSDPTAGFHTVLQ